MSAGKSRPSWEATMRRRLVVVVSGILLALAAGSDSVRAQTPYWPGSLNPYRINGYFAAPGLYGMALGAPSYGSVRTYTEFSSPYGPGYALGYAPYGLLPGRYGVGLWRPGFVAPGYVYGSSYYYRTFAVPFGSGGVAALPPVGIYAPGFGPSSTW
jgi:hypothetical protein